MIRLLQRRRPDGEQGAIAIIVSLVMLFVLLPTVALALTSYTRSAVAGEKQRAADSGALTGAASLTLVDLSHVPNLNVLTIPPGSTAFALSRACKATVKAEAVDNRLSSTFAGAPTTCTPGYTPDTSLQPCVNQILGALPALPTLGLPPITIPGIPPLIPPIIIPGGTATTGNIFDIVRSLLPGLLHNGVTVTLDYTVSGPIDALLGRSAPDPSVSKATARRRFKALLPDLNVLLGLPSVTSVPQVILVSAIQALLAQLQALVGPVTVDQTAVNNLLTTLLPTLTIPTIPLLPLGVVSATCANAVHEVISDLQDALKTNPDPSQDLLSCVEQIVLGLAPNFDPLNPLGTLVPLNPTVNTSCTEKVFRAELTA